MLCLILVAILTSGCAWVSRVSVDSQGRPGNEGSVYPAISDDGRYIAFASLTSNLVPEDTNGTADAFVHDRRTRTTTRVSVDDAGVQGNGETSFRPAISGDGRYIAFTSYTSNLVRDDTNNAPDIFVHDRATGRTSRVSVGRGGRQANHVAVDWPVPEGPAMSEDGRFIAFESNASNLVADDTNGLWDVFVHDRENGKTTRVNVDDAGRETVSGPDPSARGHHVSLSDDGRYVAFHSNVPNLVAGDTNQAYDMFVHDRRTRSTTRVSLDETGAQRVQGVYGSISGNGRYVAYLGEPEMRIFLYDRQTGETRRVAVDSIGKTEWWTPWISLSDDGRSVVFDGALSGDGRYVAYYATDSPMSWVSHVFARYTVIPHVDSVTPAVSARGVSIDVAITGRGFHPGTTVSLGEGIAVDSVRVVDETQIRASVTISPDAAMGVRDVQVTNVGSFGPTSGSTNFCLGCLRIT